MNNRTLLWIVLTLAAVIIVGLGAYSLFSGGEPVSEAPPLPQSEPDPPEVDTPVDAPAEEAPAEDQASEPPPSTETSAELALIDGGQPPARAESEFSTDFDRTIIPFSEVLSGGPPKDGIPAVDSPQFVSVAEADDWLEPLEPIALVELNGDARAFPIQILMWHEIANAEVGGQPVTVTFCPLCNTAIAFNRELNGLVMDFGTTGRLRFSNLIMYDRQTETWWQQATGEAIVGEQVGSQLEFLPISMISWEQFKSAFPEGQVLSRDTGFGRSYGQNPYVGYDNIERSPFLYQGPQTPGELPAMARVITVELADEAVAYPYATMAQVNVVNDVVGGRDLVVFWQPGVASALDSAAISTGEDVGAVDVFSRQLNGETLSFSFTDGKIVDEQSGSEWNVLGQAVSGPLAGEQLEPVVAINHFWFSWAAFRPDTRVYLAPA